MKISKEDSYIESLKTLSRNDLEALEESHRELEKKVLANPKTRRIYDDTRLKIELGFQARRIREKARMTQSEVADRLHTKQAYIARLERGNQNVTIHTLNQYACACGKHLKISFT